MLQRKNNLSISVYVFMSDLTCIQLESESQSAIETDGQNKFIWANKLWTFIHVRYILLLLLDDTFLSAVKNKYKLGMLLHAI